MTACRVFFRTETDNVKGIGWSECAAGGEKNNGVLPDWSSLRAAVVEFLATLPRDAVVFGVCEIQHHQSATKDIAVYYRGGP